MIRVATDVGGTFTDLVYFEIDKKTKNLKIQVLYYYLYLFIMN